MEKISETPKNTFEEETEFTQIKWGEVGMPQKFVQVKDQDGNTCIMSYPTEGDTKLHMGVLMKGLEYFKAKGKTITKVGGGFLIKKADGSLRISGTSTQLGAFNAEEVVSALEKAFPGVVVDVRE